MKNDIDVTVIDVVPLEDSFLLPSEIDETGEFEKADAARDAVLDSVHGKLVKLGFTVQEIDVAFGLSDPDFRKVSRKAMADYRAANREKRKGKGNNGNNGNNGNGNNGKAVGKSAK
jgi:hypothetical protein